MNILFFLTPKSEVAFIYSDANLREAIDLMEAHRYSALPIPVSYTHLTLPTKLCV